MTLQIVNVVGFLLPDPKQLINTGFPIRAAKRHDRKLLCEIIAVDDAEQLYGMRGCSVFPVRAHVLIGIPYAFRKDSFAVFDIYAIGITHKNRPLCIFVDYSTKGLIRKEVSQGLRFRKEYVRALIARYADLSFMTRRTHSLPAFRTFEVFVCLAVFPFLLFAFKEADDLLTAVQKTRVFFLTCGDASR